MAINKKLIHFNNFSTFNSQKLSANKENTKYTLGINGIVKDVTVDDPLDILYLSICYIKDTKQQWTHGQLYNCSGEIPDETDPIFSASPAATITAEHIETWDSMVEFSNLLDLDVAKLTSDVENMKTSLNEVEDFCDNFDTMDLSDENIKRPQAVPGKNNYLTPLDVATSSLHSANRLQFADPAGIKLEYSTDAGQTWIEYTTDDFSNEDRILLMSGKGSNTTKSLYAGNALSETATASDMLRITLTALTLKVYTAAKLLLINFSTNGSNNCNLDIETAYRNSETNFTVWKHTLLMKGWSGWNRIPLNFTFGGSASLTTQIGAIRLTFHSSGASGGTGKHFKVYDLQLFGPEYWTTPSMMAKTGHLYDYNSDQTMVLPKGLLPKTTGTADLGASNYYWNNVFINKLFIGGNNKNTKGYIYSDSATNMYISQNGVTPFVIVASDPESPIIRSGFSMSGKVSLGASDNYWKGVYSDKFIKKNSTDNYVLLGGGGHKSLSAIKNEIDHLIGKGAQNNALLRDLTANPKETTLFTGGWNTGSSDKTYATDYGTTLDISYSTWYQRLGFNTSKGNSDKPRIEYFQGINTSDGSLTKIGDLAYLSDITDLIVLDCLYVDDITNASGSTLTLDNAKTKSLIDSILTGKKIYIKKNNKNTSTKYLYPISYTKPDSYTNYYVGYITFIANNVEYYLKFSNHSSSNPDTNDYKNLISISKTVMLTDTDNSVELNNLSEDVQTSLGKADNSIQGISYVSIPGGKSYDLSKTDGKVTLPTASTSKCGLTMLSNSISSSATNYAATSYAVKQVNDSLNYKVVSFTIDDLNSDRDWSDTNVTLQGQGLSSDNELFKNNHFLMIKENNNSEVLYPLTFTASDNSSNYSGHLSCNVKGTTYEFDISFDTTNDKISISNIKRFYSNCYVADFTLEDLNDIINDGTTKSIDLSSLYFALKDKQPVFVRTDSTSDFSDVLYTLNGGFTHEDEDGELTFIDCVITTPTGTWKITNISYDHTDSGKQTEILNDSKVKFYYTQPYVLDFTVQDIINMFEDEEGTIKYDSFALYKAFKNGRSVVIKNNDSTNSKVHTVIGSNDVASSTGSTKFAWYFINTTSIFRVLTSLSEQPGQEIHEITYEDVIEYILPKVNYGGVTNLASNSTLKTINGKPIYKFSSTDANIYTYYPITTLTRPSVTMTASPNTFYKFGTSTAPLTSINITLGSEVSSIVVNEYVFEIYTTTTVPTLSLTPRTGTGTIKWVSGEAPVLEENKIYQISIINNLATVLSWDNA